MKMKYVLLAVFILALGFEIYRIEKQLSAVTLELTKTSRAPVKITELTEATTFDTTDVFLVSDAGTTSRKLTGRKITGAIHDSAEVLRSQMDTSGGGTFSGDTIEFSDGSRIFGGGGQIDIQPGPGIPSEARLSIYSAGSGDSVMLNSNNKNLIVSSPLFGVTNYTTFGDSVYLDYIGGASITGGVYLLLSPTQAIDTGRTQIASIGMRRPLRPISEQVSDTVNGEMKWTFYKNGEWVTQYGVKNSDPIATDESHTIAIEEAYRYILELEQRVKYLESIAPERKKNSNYATIGILVLIVSVFGVITWLNIKEGKR